MTVLMLYTGPSRVCVTDACALVICGAFPLTAFEGIWFQIFANWFATMTSKAIYIMKQLEAVGPLQPCECRRRRRRMNLSDHRPLTCLPRGADGANNALLRCAEPHESRKVDDSCGDHL